jgi:hypothetical protein
VSGIVGEGSLIHSAERGENAIEADPQRRAWIVVLRAGTTITGLSVRSDSRPAERSPSSTKRGEVPPVIANSESVFSDPRFTKPAPPCPGCPRGTTGYHENPVSFQVLRRISAWAAGPDGEGQKRTGREGP